jgi:hypothetical protein
VISAVAICLAVPTAFASLFAPSANASMVLAGSTILLWSVPLGPITAALYSVTRPRMRATASAITIFFISVLGFGMGPFCVGVLSDALASSFKVESIRYALLLPVAMLPVLMTTLFAVSKTFGQDLKDAGVSVN